MAFLDDTGLTYLWGKIKETFASKEVATTSADGLMSASDKTKLNGVAAGATANAGTITSVTTSAPLSGSGTSGSVAISHAASGVAAGTFGPAAALTPDFGGTAQIGYVTVNATGHVTAGGSVSVTIPSAVATSTKAGLMAAIDKSKLEGIATGANNYTLPAASPSVRGGIKVGANLSVASDVLSVPVASASVAGVVKAGSGLSVAADGTLNCAVSGGIVLKGTVASQGDLPEAASSVEGDLYLVGAQSPYKEFIYTASGWEELGIFDESIDPSDFVMASDVISNASIDAICV